MSADPTRRTLIAALGAAPIAGLVAAGCPSPAPAADTGLEAAIAAYRRAQAAAKQHHETVCEPTREQWEAARAAVPHRRTVNSFRTLGGVDRTLDTSDPHLITMARRVCQDFDDGKMGPAPDYEQTMRELVSLADEREAELTRVTVESGIDAAVEANNDLSDEQVRLLDLAMAYPVTTIGALARKVAFIDECDSWEDTDMHSALAADIRRLAGAA